jgi:hypothetical protein
MSSTLPPDAEAYLRALLSRILDKPGGERIIREALRQAGVEAMLGAPLGYPELGAVKQN